MNTHTSSMRRKRAKGGLRTESRHANAIRLLLTMLVLAALAASSEAMSSHFGGHAAHSLIASGNILNVPWMY